MVCIERRTVHLLTKTIPFYHGYCSRIRVFYDVFIDHQINKHFTHSFRIVNICRNRILLFKNLQKPLNYKLRFCIQAIYIIYLFNKFKLILTLVSKPDQNDLERNVSQSHFRVNLISLQPTSYAIYNLTFKYPFLCALYIA